MTFDRISSVQKISRYTVEHQQNHNRYLDMLKQEFMQNIEHPPDTKKSPEEFDKVVTLGSGSFGVVFLVRDTCTLKYHAMKALEKEVIIKKNSLKQLLLEKKILQSVNFPFLISLDFCCKDNSYIYLIMPYELGGELFTLIKKLSILSEPLAVFYGAQMVLALEYLHYCSVIHRDVKPENILICESGFIKLTDFGFCKIVKSRTWTICGTPEYLAPEIIMSKGYTHAVDWWALGILIYEMIAGYPPFYHSNTMKLYDKVLTGQFKTPAGMSGVCKSLVKGLLEVDPVKRMGALKSGVYDIKSHAWFQEIDWTALLYQKINPPYKPSFKNAGDTSNFRNIKDCKLKMFTQCLFEQEFEEF